MLAAERLEVGRRVDVGDWHQVLGVDYLAEYLPAVFDLMDVGHVGQRATGAQVGQDDWHAPPAALGKSFGPIGQDVGGFGHEMDAAKHNGLAGLVFGRGRGQLIAVASQVRQRDYFVPLIVVSQDQQPRRHLSPHPLDALSEHVVGQRLIGRDPRQGILGRRRRRAIPVEGHRIPRGFQDFDRENSDRLSYRISPAGARDRRPRRVERPISRLRDAA